MIARERHLGRRHGQRAGDAEVAGAEGDAMFLTETPGREATGESEQKRKAKAKVGQEVPDRNLRLPDELPRLRAHGGAARTGRLRADRRRPRRRRRRHQHLQRARARRGEALHAPRRVQADGHRRGPAADRRRRRLRRAAGGRADSEALERRGRHHRYAESETPADARRSRRPAGPGRRRHGRSRSASTTSRFRSASRAAPTR